MAIPNNGDLEVKIRVPLGSIHQGLIFVVALAIVLENWIVAGVAAPRGL